MKEVKKEEYDPNKCFVNLTYKCNNRCVSCIMPTRNLQGEKSLKQIKIETNEILKNSGHIEFNGGEPTLNKDLFRILHYTNEKKENVEVALITNARIFSILDYVNKLNSLNLKNFKIVTTLYGHKKEIHDGITRTPCSFEQQIKAIKNLINKRIQIELRIVINKLNYKYLDKIAQFIIENFNREDFLSVIFISMKIIGEAYKNRRIVVYKISDAIPHISKAAERLTEKKFKVGLFHLPHCVLPRKLWNLSGGITAERSEICFLPFCKNCTKKEKCSGIWKSYIEVFSPNEFNPIKEK